jgi:DNA-binding NarL/FixJ family response regulator
MGRTARPLVVVEGRTGLLGQPMAVAVAAARRDGWEIVRGWVAPLGRERVVCTGAIRTADDARRALLAAVSGAGLIVGASADRMTIDRFLDDLRRLGPVEHVLRRRPTRPRLTDGQRALLGLIAEGLTVREAAAELRIARSTADGRLAAARRALGVESTAAAIVATLAGGR